VQYRYQIKIAETWCCLPKTIFTRTVHFHQAHWQTHFTHMAVAIMLCSRLHQFRRHICLPNAPANTFFPIFAHGGVASDVPYVANTLNGMPFYRPTSTPPGQMPNQACIIYGNRCFPIYQRQYVQSTTELYQPPLPINMHHGGVMIPVNTEYSNAVREQFSSSSSSGMLPHSFSGGESIGSSSSSGEIPRRNTGQ
jgi:hypothetical protein